MDASGCAVRAGDLGRDVDAEVDVRRAARDLAEQVLDEIDPAVREPDSGLDRPAVGIVPGSMLILECGCLLGGAAPPAPDARSAAIRMAACQVVLPASFGP